MAKVSENTHGMPVGFSKIRAPPKQVFASLTARKAPENTAFFLHEEGPFRGCFFIIGDHNGWVKAACRAKRTLVEI